MDDSEIKFKVVSMLNGIKYLTRNQIEDFKAYAYHSLNLSKSERVDKLIEESVKLYFSILVEIR